MRFTVSPSVVQDAMPNLQTLISVTPVVCQPDELRPGSSTYDVQITQLGVVGLLATSSGPSDPAMGSYGFA